MTHRDICEESLTQFIRKITFPIHNKIDVILLTSGTSGEINEKLLLSFYFYLLMCENSESFKNCFEPNRSGES